MKHSSICLGSLELCRAPSDNRVQIYFFLLNPQNDSSLFRVAIELKKLILPFAAHFSLQFANYTLQFYTLL